VDLETEVALPRNRAVGLAGVLCGRGTDAGVVIAAIGALAVDDANHIHEVYALILDGIHSVFSGSLSTKPTGPSESVGSNLAVIQALDFIRCAAG
jgi:hypothetical protein